MTSEYIEPVIELLAELIEHYRLPIEVSIASINRHVSIELDGEASAYCNRRQMQGMS